MSAITQPLDEFLATTDPNAWWRQEAGDQLNLFEEAIGRMQAAEAAVARVRELHYPVEIPSITACDKHSDVARFRDRGGDCRECTVRTVTECANITCCGWPCPTITALDGMDGKDGQ